MNVAFRKILVCLIAVLAFSAVVASAASAETAAEQQQFENAAGHEPTLKGFTSTSGAVRLDVSGLVFECKKDTDVGKLVGKESLEKVVITFTECEEPTKGCEIHSVTTPASNNGEIKTNMLRGELGEVAAAEATSKVGLLLEPEAGSVFVTLTSSISGCLPVQPSTVEGSVVGEVTPLTLGLTDKTEFLLSGGAQKIKTFERSFAKHCTGAPIARKCGEDFSFNAKLSFLGKILTIEGSDTNKFDEELKVNPGV